MTQKEELKVVSKELKDAELNEKDLDIVMYSVKHHLIADLQDTREKGCIGVVNGIHQAVKSQGRDDLNALIKVELQSHSTADIV